MTIRRYALLSVILIALVAGMAFGTSLGAQAAAKNFFVPANRTWVSTRVTVVKGQKVNLKVTGRARTAPVDSSPKSISGPAGQKNALGCGMYRSAPPPCAMNGALYGALVGKIGSGKAFYIGTTKVFTANASGTLYLSVNDNLAYYTDNSGGYTVAFK
jgi:hypothetical protein